MARFEILTHLKHLYTVTLTCGRTTVMDKQHHAQ